ncbi:MAG: hypothetical protein HYU66_27015 [Armatimonadetes bacterium]|nr:hypothetical protein [Armatimonadota bacterium]
MLAGTYDVKFDAASRFTVPARLRAGFDGDVLIVTAGVPIGRNLLLFEEAQFKTYFTSVFRDAAADFDEDQLSVKRFMLGSSATMKLDSAGRGVVPAELLHSVGISEDARVVGIGDMAEIWAVGPHERWRESMDSDEMKIRCADARRRLAAARMGQGGGV